MTDILLNGCNHLKKTTIKHERMYVYKNIYLAQRAALVNPLHILLSACRSPQLCADKQRQLCAVEQQQGSQSYNRFHRHLKENLPSEIPAGGPSGFLPILTPRNGSTAVSKPGKHLSPDFFPPFSPSDAGSSRTDADASILLASGLHFNSSPGRRLTCPGLSSSHDPCVCPRDQHFHLRKSVPLNISVSHPRQRERERKKTYTHTPFMDMLEQSLDSSAR